ncbi:hypothetical protein [Bacillus thuringiensis]|nr:hypothetical protein [Bacillus thuringiensis]
MWFGKNLNEMYGCYIDCRSKLSFSGIDILGIIFFGVFIEVG